MADLKSVLQTLIHDESLRLLVTVNISFFPYSCRQISTFTVVLRIRSCSDASNLTPRNLTVTNPQPCDSSNWTSLFVAAPTGGPLVLFVDPPVIYNGITIGVLVYTAGLNTTAQSVVAVNSATGTNYYNLTIQPSSNYNQIPVLIPAGTLPAGTYDIIVNSPYAIGGCLSVLRNGLIVKSQVTIKLLSVNPTYIWVNASQTPITISADPTVVPFQPTPRGYIASSGSCVQ